MLARLHNGKFVLCTFFDLKFVNSNDNVVIDDYFTENKQYYWAAELFQNRIFLTDFDQCIISKSNFEQVKFLDCRFSKTILDENRFDTVTIRENAFSEVSIKFTIFDRTKIANSNIGSSKFLNSQFLKTSFNNIKFSETVFDSCTFYQLKISRCQLDCKFINCHFIDLDVKDCLTSMIKVDNFNTGHFKLICYNCSFVENSKSKL